MTPENHVSIPRSRTRRPSGGVFAAAMSLMTATCVVLPPAAQAGQAALSTPSRGDAVAPRGTEAAMPKSAPAPDVDLSSRSVAARARMNECGHQWSNMKHAGTAAGTWKDFSRGCLAQR